MGLFGFLAKATGVIVTYGEVIAGDYNGMDITSDGKRVIFSGFKNKYMFSKNDVEKYETNNVTDSCGEVTIWFKDGKKSLLKVDHKGLNVIQKILF